MKMARRSGVFKTISPSLAFSVTSESSLTMDGLLYLRLPLAKGEVRRVTACLPAIRPDQAFTFLTGFFAGTTSAAFRIDLA
jgi:hypothetical protein